MPSPLAEPRSRARRSGDRFFVLALLPLLLSVLAFAVAGPVTPSPKFLVLLATANLAWLVAVALARAGAGDARVVVVGAIALRVIALAAEPELSEDVYRYVWEGELVARGTSPYAHAPDSAEHADLRRECFEVFARMNHRHVPAAYPPLAQVVHAALVVVARTAAARSPIEGERAAGGSQTVRVMRVFYALCDLFVLVPLASILRRHGLPRSLLVVWAWCPLVVTEFAGSAHLDSLAILLLVSALALLDASRPWRLRSGRVLLGLALLAGAILVKLLPVCALPFVARGRGGLLRAGLVLALVALGFLPLALLEHRFTGLGRGLAEYAFRWEWQSLAYRGVEPVLASFLDADEGLLDPRRVGRVVVGLVWIAWGVRAWRKGYGPIRGSGSLVGAWLVLTPTLHPWYVTWIAPFVVLRPSMAWTWLLATVSIGYLPLLVWREGASSAIVEPAWLWPLVALPFFALAVYEARYERAIGGIPGALAPDR